MRIYGLVLAASAMTLGACGGGDKTGDNNAAKPADTTAAAPAAAPASNAAAPAGAAGAAGTAMAITGKTVDVKEIGDAQGYRFDPATLTIKVGDGIKFTNITGGPHNVTFWADSIPAGTQAQLQANMPNTTSPLTGPLLINANDSYTVSFAGLKPGVYHFYCTPHLALGMKGTVTVQ
jgi:plastocyanin